MLFHPIGIEEAFVTRRAFNQLFWTVVTDVVLQPALGTIALATRGTRKLFVAATAIATCLPTGAFAHRLKQGFKPLRTF